jgi:hypothetical protein
MTELPPGCEIKRMSRDIPEGLIQPGGSGFTWPETQSTGSALAQSDGNITQTDALFINNK